MHTDSEAEQTHSVAADLNLSTLTDLLKLAASRGETTSETLRFLVESALPAALEDEEREHPDNFMGSLLTPAPGYEPGSDEEWRATIAEYVRELTAGTNWTAT